MSDQITAEDLCKLRNMLAAWPINPAKEWGYRNYYAAGKSSEPAMRRLESAGFVRQGAPYQDSFYFHATKEGCKAIGMNDAQIKHAMED